MDPTLAGLGACPGVLPQSRTAWFLGDLSFPGQAETLLPPRGCHAFGGARSQACRRAAGIRPLPWEALLPHIPYLLSLQLRAVVSGQQQRPPRAQLLRSLGNHRLVRHEAGDGGRERAGGRPAQSIAAPLTPLEPAPPGAAWARGSGGGSASTGQLSTHGCCSALLPACSSVGARSPLHYSTPWWAQPRGPVAGSCPAWVFSFPSFRPCLPVSLQCEEGGRVPGLDGHCPAGARAGLSTLHW